MKILFDMSSVMWTCLGVGDDADSYDVQHNGKTVVIKTALYGYENSINMMVKAIDEWKLVPKDCILVFEGKDSKKRRCMIEPTYKGGLTQSRPPEAYLEFNRLKEKLLQVWRDLGAIAVTQDFVEGDDVLAWLAADLEEDHIVVTNDNDMIVLNGVNKHGSKCFVRVNGVVGANKYGDFALPLVTLYKATVGDSGDNIKGCHGFGATAFLNVNGRYGDDGCFELLELIKTGNRNEVAQIAVDNSCKFLNKLVDNWDAVIRSYRLALLHPEWVNTIRTQVQWFPGVVKSECEDERLRHWKGQNRPVTANNYEAALDFLCKKLSENAEVTFDIETSTPDESDDWLEAQGNPNGVDVFGSYLTGFSLTFGKNNQYTYYVSVKHRDTDNVSMVMARKMMEACFNKKIVIQNTSFELSVLHEAQDEDGSYWRDHWTIYGEQGFMPNVLDTMLEGSYVDENIRLGLKFRSQHHLGYTQASFDDTVQKSGPAASLLAGGRVIKSWDEDGVLFEKRQYKMKDLTAPEAFAYGADDTICTAALHNFYKLVMQLEHTWQVYLDVEIDAAYLHAKSFVDGITFSLSKMKELEAIDKTTSDTAWQVVRNYLMAHGWEGTVPPIYTAAITAKEIKQAYAIVMGLDAADEEADEEEVDEDASTYHVDAPKVEKVDAFLSTRVRTPAKLLALLKAEGHDTFAAMLEGCLAGQAEEFTTYVCRHFTGEPKFKMSNKSMCKLLYVVMELPIKVRNKPTAAMKLKGIKEGNPKGDALAIEYALLAGSPEQVETLRALKLVSMVRTRMGLYYSKYPYLIHWKDGKIHSSHNQCATNTRRASSSGPNMQQLPKHAKIEGEPSRFREVIVPHKPDAVIVSLDFDSQELRVIADYSKDKNMVACFVGDNKKGMHSLTGVNIAIEEGFKDWTYEKFEEYRNDESSEFNKKAKAYRVLGKKVNFTTEYLAAAPKLAMTLLVDEAKAQKYIDAREAAFPEAKAWKDSVILEAKQTGFVLSKCGARRHLADLLNSDDRFTASKAERQSVNFKIQSSSAEMTKLAEGRVWRSGVLSKFDCSYIGPVHDEMVWSVAKKDLPDFLKIGNACMVEKYADMEIPILTGLSFGPSFGKQFEIGTEPTDEAVALGFEQWSKQA